MFKPQICHAQTTVLLQCTIVVRKSHRHPESTLGDCEGPFSQLILAFRMGSSTIPPCVHLAFVNFAVRPHRQKCNTSDRRVGRTVRASSKAWESLNSAEYVGSTEGCSTCCVSVARHCQCVSAHSTAFI
jgi:hypothetical protein